MRLLTSLALVLVLAVPIGGTASGLLIRVDERLDDLNCSPHPGVDAAKVGV